MAKIKISELFTDKQKNWLLGLLALTTVFSVVLNITGTGRSGMGYAMLDRPRANMVSADSWHDNMIEFCYKVFDAAWQAQERGEVDTVGTIMELYDVWGCGHVVGAPYFVDVLY